MIAAGRSIPILAGVRTLVWLDAHLLKNRIVTTIKNPLRLLLWLAFIGVMAAGLQGRMMINAALRTHPLPRPEEGPPSFLVDPTFWLHLAATFVPGLALILLAVFVLVARRQPVAAFKSAADARFLIGSALSPRVVVLWLMVRSVLSLSWRIPLSLIFLVILLPEFGFRTDVGVRALAALFLLGVILSINTPIFITHQRRIGPDPGIVGFGLLAIGAAAVVVVGVALSPGTPMLPTFLPPIAAALPPGSWLVGVVEGNLVALVPLGILAMAALVVTWLVAADAYPELWQASARVIVIRRAMRRRGWFLTRSETRRLLNEAGVSDRAGSRRETAVSSRGRWVPSGAWSVLWKEWLASRRVAGGLRIPMTLLVIAVAGGAAIGILSRSASHLVEFVLPPIVYVVLFGSLFTAFRMSADLRKPIWWLSASSLRARLGVMVLARSLRSVVPLAAGLVTASVFAIDPSFVTVGLPIVAATGWALNAMGLAIYAIIPSSADMRGPGGLLRSILFFAMLIPIGVAALVGGIAAGGTGALVTSTLTAFSEGWLLIIFAAAELDGNGLAYAQGERR